MENQKKLQEIVANDPAPVYFQNTIEPSEFLTFDTYQAYATETAIYPYKGHLMGLMYCGLGAAEEAGEVAGKIKKVLRDNHGVVDDIFREKIKAEVGDTLWYLSQVAKELGSSLGSIARESVVKLRGRRERGTIHGDGDNR